ncbi:MAG: SDR family NAD(P)-dependent oxidoreductase [Dehalococcoidia bacterium]
MILDQFRLTDRLAIVTGAGQGIGRGIALTLAEAGANIVVADRNGETATSTAADIRSLGREALPYEVDLRRGEDVAGMVDAATREFGRLDILVNNAGGGFDLPTLDISERGWDAVLRVNLNTTFNASRECVRYMKDHGGGAIASIASVAATHPSPRRAVYGATKAGIISLTQSWSVEWAPYGIRVNAVAPGAILSGPGVADLFGTPEQQAAAAARVPLGRMGTPEDIGAATLFLVSDAASWITGQTLFVDGGPSLAG